MKNKLIIALLVVSQFAFAQKEKSKIKVLTPSVQNYTIQLEAVNWEIPEGKAEFFFPSRVSLFQGTLRLSEPKLDRNNKAKSDEYKNKN